MTKSTEAKFAQAYTEAGGRNAGATPWAEIIAAITKLISGCFVPPATMKRWAKRNPEAFNEMVADQLKHDGAFASTKDRNAAVKAAHETFLDMSDAEIRRLRS